ncbi:helix-turn-helix domain-containing protein [Kitasatospora kifunensis]|uniref:Transcriptional regulator with XRE-family HTH domain n=1 Tax=Kitasatospora kifunensis TaxID=58351 RepID=A0A7W7QZ73_KITKI|nr:helix-turn-helix transcriptional regulator [Kitasatospora kifunensis]MBB4922536.1 transcriptional regulator with XRE-family HTH domain [Kitasatospora kifunensis]
MVATPTVRRRMLGAELRKIREALDLTVDEVASRLGWHQSKVSRLETGRSGVRANEVGIMLDVYQVTDPETREALAALAREGKRRVWWQPYSDVISQRYASFISFEAEAVSARNFESSLVPGLLQTGDYARSLIRQLRPDAAPEVVNALVDVRLARQNAALQREDPLNLWAIVDESALRRMVGNRTIMARQLHQLITASKEPHVTLQVVPFEAGAHPGIHGSFVILEFPVRNDLDVVYTEALTSSLYLERDDDVGAYSKAFDRLRAAALDVGPSRRLITQIAKESE